MVSAAAKLEKTHSAMANRRPTARDSSNTDCRRRQSGPAKIVTLVTKRAGVQPILVLCLLALQSCLGWSQTPASAKPAPPSASTALYLHLNVAGRVTAALFVGDGDVLLIPPDQGERSSLALFTGAAVLEEKFTSAYFRFFDDRFFEQLSPGLRQDSNPELVEQSTGVMKDLSQSDALRLLLAYVNTPASGPSSERYLHARISGVVHGLFDVFYDETAAEQISAG